ncbi:MAG: S26 family signal peptidase [Candidatus Micrarchaeota archaeon]|nr:S26 family signal peptidase [Candidatus Micrarchaeota archaeon]
MPRRKASSATKQKKQMPMWPLYLLLVILIIAYAVYNNPIIGIIAFLVIVAIIVVIAKEVKEEVQEKGSREGIKSLAMAIGAAVLIWVIAIVALQTTAPINAVASCSMLPSLQRGDLVILHGISNLSAFARTHNVPIVNVSPSAFSAMESGMNNEFLAYYAYPSNSRGNLTSYVPSSYPYTISLYNTQCVDRIAYLKQGYNLASCYVGQNPSQNLIKYNYSIQNTTVNGVQFKLIVTSAISINGTRISENYSNPIVVYSTTSSDTFGGDIIHRLVAVINAGGSYYTLTKGDNNPALDIQFGNYPSQHGDVLGYVIARVPVIGYAKLLLSGQFSQPAGCNQVISN